MFYKTTKTIIDGKKYAIIPLDDYESLKEKFEDMVDVAAYDIAVARAEEFFPFELAERSASGESRIAIFREYRGMTQAQLAKKTGVSANYISMLEKKRKEASLTLIKKIAAALKVDVEQLI